MLFVIANILVAESKNGLMRAFGLWSMTAGIGIVLVVTIAVAFAIRKSRRAKMSGMASKRRRKPIKDAWAEAGRRVEPIRMDEPPPETLPEDKP